jgi:putative flippase GtrA
MISTATRREAATFIRFGLSGLPGFVVGLGVNVLLIEACHWPKPVAYLLVMWVQITMGFLMARWLVFRAAAPAKSVAAAYLQYALSMGLIRVADWTLYTTLVEFLRINYVIAQVCGTALFIVIKFLFAKAIFRHKSTSIT